MEEGLKSKGRKRGRRCFRRKATMSKNGTQPGKDEKKKTPEEERWELIF